VFVLAFVGWLIDDYNLRWTKTEQLNQEISRIEQKIIEYDSRLDSFTEFSNKNSELNENYIDSKIEALINKAMLEFYKSQ
jgi:cell division septum initiation protein DivIVA